MDEFTIVLDEVPISGGTLIPTPPLIFRTSVDRESLMIVTIQSELDIDAYGHTRNEVIQSINTEIDVLWRNYAMADDSTLSSDAIVLKNKLKDRFSFKRINKDKWKKAHPEVVEVPYTLNIALDAIKKEHGIDVRGFIIPTVLTLLSRKDEEKTKNQSPEFGDFDYQDILDWAKKKHDLKIDFVKDEGWGFSWEFGMIGFDLSRVDNQQRADKATALFIYLYTRGISAQYAEMCAQLYAYHVSVKKIP